MSDFFYATDSNIKRFRNLLETSVDETERRTIQRLLTEEVPRQGSRRRKLGEAALNASSDADARSSWRIAELEPDLRANPSIASRQARVLHSSIGAKQ